MMHREANTEWRIDRLANGNVTHADAQLAVLMDIRCELSAINSKLNCWRVTMALRALEELGLKLRRENRNRRKKKNARR